MVGGEIRGTMDLAIVRARAKSMPQYLLPSSAVPYALTFLAQLRLRGGVSESWNNSTDRNSWDNGLIQQITPTSGLMLSLYHDTCCLLSTSLTPLLMAENVKMSDS